MNPSFLTNGYNQEISRSTCILNDLKPSFPATLVPHKLLYIDANQLYLPRRLLSPVPLEFTTIL